MTTFGWDQSHYDAPMTARDGIDFVTHKCAEGHHFYKDSEYKVALDAARNLGVPVLGAYFVNHPGSIQDQVDWFLSIVNAETPWWKDVPWMFQIDAEKFQYMDRAPTIAEVNAFGDLLVNRTGVPSHSVFAYAPYWLYGLKLEGLKYPLWQSAYGANPVLPYRQAYPGDTSYRWNPYNGSNVVILQYGSTTTIAGQTTCDANAFRGTLAQLLDFIGSDEMADVHYKIQSTDPEYNGKVFVSNRINRRLVRTPGAIYVPACSGTNAVVLTDAMRATVNASWEDYLDAVAGPVPTEGNNGGNTGDFTSEQVAAIVRDELDKTKFTKIQ